MVPLQKSTGVDVATKALLSVSRADRGQAGGCQACYPSEQPDKVGVIMMGQAEWRICDKHWTELAELIGWLGGRLS
jgi:hypothetical protein